MNDVYTKSRPLEESDSRTLVIRMAGRWMTHSQFEALIAELDLLTQLRDDGRVLFVFDGRSGLPAGVGMRLLSLLNQLATVETGSVELEFATRDGLFGYLSRNGFFDFLDSRIVTTPGRPRYSGATLFRGRAGSLVEIAELRPGLVGTDRDDAVTPLVSALSRWYPKGRRARHLQNCTFATLTELIDNVYSHSETALPGYAILQAYPNRHRPAVQIAVSDSGIGIPESIRRGLKDRVRKQSDGALIVRAFEKGLSRLGRQAGRSCGLPRCAQLASKFGSTVWVRTPSADVALRPSSTEEGPLEATIHRPSSQLEGTHICLEFPLNAA